MADCNKCIHLPVCKRQIYCMVNGKVVCDYCLEKKQATSDEIKRWIPVTERLPDADGDYLVYKVAYGHGWCEVYGFAKDARKVNKYDFYDRWENVWYDYDNEYGYVTHDSVTHWMPLPEPPNCGAKMDGDVNG